MDSQQLKDPRLQTQIKTTGDDDFQISLYISLFLHATLAFFLIIKVTFFSPDTLPPHKKIIRVDIVDLPKKYFQKTTMNKKAVKSTKPKRKSRINLKKVMSAQKRALEKIKKSRPRTTDLLALKEQSFKGNILNPGTALKGLHRIQHNTYLNKVDSHVKQYWNLPQWLSEGDFKAHVVVYLDKRGFVTKVSFSKPSKNSLFDKKIVEAIRKASPFPEPPQKFENILAVDGIELRFPE